MEKIFITLTIILNYSLGFTQDSFRKIFSKVEECQDYNIKNCNIEIFKEVKLKLLEIGKLDTFINFDTLYIIETYSPDNGCLLGDIWDGKENHLVFSFHINFEYLSSKLLTNFTYKLIKNWDIEKIRLEEKENSKMTPISIIFVSRIEKTNSEYKIDCINFKEFFLLERDRFD